MMLNVFVPGTPTPQGSARAFVVKGKAVITSANPKLKSWRQDVAVVAAGKADFGANAVCVELIFYFARPASHFNSKGEVKPTAPTLKTTNPDLDKLARGAIDALTIAGIWKDDNQVVGLYCVKKFCGGDAHTPSSPGTRIVVFEEFG